jgi:DNA-binding NtrC family response regulator
MITPPRRHSAAGRPMSLTLEQELELVAWYRARMTVKQKAAELGIAETTLRNALARHGLDVGRTLHAAKVREWEREWGEA